MPRAARRQPKEPRIVTCYHCNYSTKIKSNLQKHITNVHVLKRGVPREKFFSCPMCNFTTTRVKMFDHYSNKHEVPICKSSHNFTNLEEFRSWKTKVEKEETSRYIVLKGVSKLKSCNVWYYRCHRDGFFNSKGTGKRNLKVKGTNKINGCCPSEMKVMEDKETGNVQVHFVDTHVGHSKDLNRLPLLKEDKDRIAEKLALKVPLSIVLDEIQNSKSEEQKLERIHLITRKDVLNIASSYKLKNDCIRKSIDGVSNEMEDWVKHIREETEAVRLYKPQGAVDSEYPQLNKTDFVLIIYNNAQLEYLRAYGGSCVCLDRTHQRSTHDFELTSLLVTDELNQGFPCAFMLSNRADVEVVSIFVNNLVQSLGGPLECKMFMSDVSNMYYDAWCSSMHVPSSRFFCSWHVDRAWRKFLMKIKNSEKRAYAYKIAKALAMDRNREQFEQEMNSAITDLKTDSETVQFAEFLQGEFSRSYCWAHCYRSDGFLEKNSPLESISKAIKNVFLQGKKCKRLDKSLSDLMKLTRDKLFDQSILAHKSHLPVDLAFIQKRHDVYLMSMTPDLSFQKSANGWRVITSPSDEPHEVVPNNLACQCHIRCEQCRMCYHSFKCSCAVSVVEWNICKHIHFVASSVSSMTIQISHIQQAPQEVLHTPQPVIHQSQQVQLNHNSQQIQHQIQHNSNQIQHVPQVQHVSQVQHAPQQVQRIPQFHRIQVQHASQPLQHAPHHHVQHATQLQQIQQAPHQIQQAQLSSQVQQAPQNTSQQVLQHVSNKTINHHHQSDDDDRDDDRSMEVLHICETNVARELEDLIFKQFVKPEDCDSELKQAKNSALKLVQDIFDAVETRAQLDIFTNAILPVLPTITAMKYSGCTYK
uniref:C2H2-type domain-containing protein n=1 Tax=Lygus hesperus TaxID=30085 RepID=A0A0A9Z9U1_LYGHE